MDKVQALVAFWESFGVPAYDEAKVPEDATYPRITYNVATDSLNNQVPLTASLWDKSTSWKAITQLQEQIAERVKGQGYEIRSFDGGYIYIMGGTPFAQRVTDPNIDINRIYINLTAEFLCKY